MLPALALKMEAALGIGLIHLQLMHLHHLMPKKIETFHKLLVYSQVNQDQASVQSALVSGLPLVIGISVFQSIEDNTTAATGIIPMPGWLDAPIGGHALCVDSYDENYVSGPNSWGNSWGDKGYFHLPWKYLLDSNLCSDIWSIGVIT